MARLLMCGAEIDPAARMDGNRALTSTGTVTRDTGTFRSGSASYKCDSGASGGVASLEPNILGTGTPADALAGAGTYFCRAYFNFANLPGSATPIMSAGSDIQVVMTTAGNLQLTQGGVQIGSDSTALSTGSWYRVELKLVRDASNWTSAELQLDGVSVASGSFTDGVFADWLRVGWASAPGNNRVVYVDDIAVNSSSGGSNNSWPGAGKVILMKPISDNARGAWTGGAGGTTNLWDAVDNVPPVGVAESSATNTSQIKNRTTTNPTNCDLNLDTYTNAGIGSGATINAIQVIADTGEDPATGTKAGTIAMVSNPAIGPSGSFNFGLDLGLQGTYVGNWRSFGVMSDAPSVTLGTAPVIRITCSSGATNSRSASCDFLGAYVDYTDARSLPPISAQSIPNLINR